MIVEPMPKLSVAFYFHREDEVAVALAKELRDSPEFEATLRTVEGMEGSCVAVCGDQVFVGENVIRTHLGIFHRRKI